jgi:hypothetical protein
VLNALGERLTTAEMAVRLCISVRRVESHVSALLRKLAEPDRLHWRTGPAGYVHRACLADLGPVLGDLEAVSSDCWLVSSASALNVTAGSEWAASDGARHPVGSARRDMVGLPAGRNTDGANAGSDEVLR